MPGEVGLSTKKLGVVLGVGSGLVKRAVYSSRCLERADAVEQQISPLRAARSGRDDKGRVVVGRRN